MDIAESYLARENHIDWGSLKPGRNAFGSVLKGYAKNSRFEVTVGRSTKDGPLIAVFVDARKPIPSVEEAYHLIEGEVEMFHRRIPRPRRL